jgi:hypothetical protein
MARECVRFSLRVCLGLFSTMFHETIGSMGLFSTMFHTL